MKETFEQYLQRLKDRRTEDDYKYTDEDFVQYQEYIRDCWLTNLSVYKCLEFMYFAEKDMDDQLFNRESKQECMITKIMQMDAKMAYDSLPKQETLEQIDQNNPITKGSTALVKKEIQPEQIWNDEKKEGLKEFIDKHKQESRNFLPGFIKQFDPKEGEINGEEWTAVHFLKWLELNKFKIVK